MAVNDVHGGHDDPVSRSEKDRDKTRHNRQGHQNKDRPQHRQAYRKAVRLKSFPHSALLMIRDVRFSPTANIRRDLLTSHRRQVSTAPRAEYYLNGTATAVVNDQPVTAVHIRDKAIGAVEPIGMDCARSV